MNSYYYYGPILNEMTLLYLYYLVCLPLLIPISAEKHFVTVKVILAIFFSGYISLTPFSRDLPPSHDWISLLHPVGLLSVVFFLYHTRKNNSESASYMIMLCLTLMATIIYLVSLTHEFVLIGSSALITKNSIVASFIITEEDIIKLYYSLSMIVMPYILWLRKRKATTTIGLSLLLLVLCYFFWPRPHLEGINLLFSPFMSLFTGYVAMTNTPTATGVYPIPHFILMGLSLIVSAMVIISVPNMWYSGFLIGY